MGIFEDVLKALDRIAEWKMIKALPARVFELETRVKELEALLNGKAPAEFCRKCGARGARLKTTMGPNDQGMIYEYWFCPHCEQTDEKICKAK